MMICGRKTTTLPTPEITPFCETLQQAVRQHGGGPIGRRTQTFRQQFHDRLRPAGNGLEHDEQDHEGSEGRPRAASTASIRVISVSGLAGGVTAAAMIRSASRWRCALGR